jgi:DNA polymerase IV
MKTEVLPRQIVHLSLPDFCTRLEEIRQPKLGRRPLSLAHSRVGAIIHGVNESARSEGIREGMPLSHAKRLCRRLESLPPDLPFYRGQHDRLLHDLDRFSPLIEGISLGSYFLDLTGTRRLFGPPPDAAARIASEVAARVALPPRIGLASNKLVSQVAAGCMPKGNLSFILSGWETSFLYPLPVTALPGVGEKTSARLGDFNIQKIGQLAAISVEALFQVFGKGGGRLSKMAQGIDPSPVVPLEKTSRLSLARNLARGEVDLELLQAVLLDLVEDAGCSLRASNRYPERFSLEVYYADGASGRVRQSLPPHAAHLDRRLFDALSRGLDQLVRRRVAIQRLTVDFTGFAVPIRQLSLFPWEDSALERDRHVQDALNEIRLRFGRQSILWGRKRTEAATVPG